MQTPLKQHVTEFHTHGVVYGWVPCFGNWAKQVHTMCSIGKTSTKAQLFCTNSDFPVLFGPDEKLQCVHFI